MNGDIKPLEFMARREDWNYGISLFARQQTGGMGLFVAKPLELTQHEKGLIIEPFARLEIEAAQQLMDELWRCGLRPTEGTGSAGSLAATEKHLKDMQKIVFKQLKIKT